MVRVGQPIKMAKCRQVCEIEEIHRDGSHGTEICRGRTSVLNLQWLIIAYKTQ